MVSRMVSDLVILNAEAEYGTCNLWASILNRIHDLLQRLGFKYSWVDLFSLTALYSEMESPNVETTWHFCLSMLALAHSQYSGQKKKVNGRKVRNIFSLLRGVNSLSRYYRENLICKSRAVNFLFLSTVDIVWGELSSNCVRSNFVFTDIGL